MTVTCKVISRVSTLVAGLAALGISMSSMAVPIITGGVWNVTGVDQGGGTWDESTLVFETQELNANGVDYDLTGYFDWVGSSGSSGRELFTGSLFSDLQLNLSGVSLVDSVGIVLGSYSALVVNASTITDGLWSGLGQPAIPGEWAASRSDTVPAVPISAPGTLVLLSLGLGLAFIGLVRRRLGTD